MDKPTDYSDAYKRQRSAMRRVIQCLTSAWTKTLGRKRSFLAGDIHVHGHGQCGYALELRRQKSTPAGGHAWERMEIVLGPEAAEELITALGGTPCQKPRKPAK